jgi:hypothetical protein
MKKTGFAFAFQPLKIEGDTINSTAMRLKKTSFKHDIGFMLAL